MRGERQETKQKNHLLHSLWENLLNAPSRRETHDLPLPKKEIFHRGTSALTQFIGQKCAMGSRFVELKDANDFQCIRSIGFLTAFDWKQEIALFTHNSHSIQIKTTYYGPFEFPL
jgi:hypothetical protein